MAVFPAVPSPPAFLDASGSCKEAGAVPVDDGDSDEDAPVGWARSELLITDVMTMTEGVGVSPGAVGVGVTVTSDVTSCVDGGREDAVTTEVACAEDGGGAGVDEGAAEDSGGAEEGGSDTGVELGCSDVGGGAEEEGSVRDGDGDGVGVGVGVADGNEDEATEETTEDSVGSALEETKKEDVRAVLLPDMAVADRKRCQADRYGCDG